MYSHYLNSLNQPSRWSRFPSYGYYDDSFVDYRDTSSWTDYWYGGDRRYPHYWEADDYSRYRTARRSTEPSTEATRPEAPAEEIAKALKVLDIDMHVKENALQHHTNRYKCVLEKGQSVVRRGDTMKITFTFDRKYDIEKNDAKILFSIGENPSEPKGTKKVMDLIEKKKKPNDFKPDEWGASLEENKEDKITVLVHIPVNCIVGRWNMVVKTFAENKDEKPLVFNKEYDQDIIILFNPWCKDDPVCMTPESSLDEYILSDEGFVFSGYWAYPDSVPWSFAQFDVGILEAALYLLNAGFGGRASQNMADALHVCRIMAKMVNVQDDRGVLVGRWDGKYDDGTSPTKWVGSGAILKQFMEKKEPVKYGQCWVFSAVLTTVCRALGIPCRSVTCFSSAHDTDLSATIDKWYDEKDEPLEWMNSDSVWNFHVWNEIWCKRYDFEDEKGWDGWQVIDATPQELSDGIYTCGPCPVAAVKRGRCDIPYDTLFVYGEVNADVVHWNRLPNGEIKRKDIETDSVGRSLYTKNPEYSPDNPRSKKGMNVVHEYKFPENSVEERNAALMAHKTARLKRDVYVKTEKGEIEFHLFHKDSVPMGDELEITFTAKHVGDYKREIKHPKISVSPKLYTGAVGKAFFKHKFDDFEMNPKDEKKMTVTLKFSDYFTHLVEGAYLYIVATAHVPKFSQRGRERPAQTIYKGHDFKFSKPTLTIDGPKTGKLGKTIEVKVTFKNPLQIPLTKCNMDIQSSGFEERRDIPLGDVPAHGTFSEKFTLTPTASGWSKHAVLFSFECKEILEVYGSHHIEITDDTSA